jgi:hypothetical protein
MPTPKEYRLRAIECLELMKEPNERTSMRWFSGVCAAVPVSTRCCR